MTEPPQRPERDEPFVPVFAAQFEIQLPTLPVDCRMALADVLESLVWDPWSASERYSPRQAPEWRTVAFGDGRGLLSFVISEKRSVIIALDAQWLG
ncbi:hypothetical protein GCM10022221_67870 [Actinocorallia aurea]